MFILEGRVYQDPAVKKNMQKKVVFSSVTDIPWTDPQIQVDHL